MFGLGRARKASKVEMRIATFLAGDASSLVLLFDGPNKLKCRGRRNLNHGDFGADEETGILVIGTDNRIKVAIEDFLFGARKPLVYMYLRCTPFDRPA